MNTAAEVFLWGQRVGAVYWDDKLSVAEFAYDSDFIKSELEVSPLMMPLGSKIYRFPTLRDSNTFKGLPGLLADSLPEKYGNRLMAIWLASQGLSFSDLNPVERLCYLGSRGMGALEFEPDTDRQIARSDNDIDLDGLLDVAKKIMDDHNKVSIEDPHDPNIDRLIQIGTSAGGAKAKAVIAWNETTGEIQSGQGNVPSGFNHYLLKFSGVSNDEHENDLYTGRMEMAYHYMAVEAGISMMKSRLLTDKQGVGHFMTERFDRDASGHKYHIQTYAAMAHQDRDPVGMCSYEHLFATARALGVGQAQINELFLRMIFNIVTRNQDDHTKNHAFMMNGAGEWLITPAYDLCFAYKAGSRWIDLHQMMCNGKRDDFTLKDIEAAAKAANVKKPEKYLAKVLEATGYWTEISNEVGLPDDISLNTKKLFRALR